MAFNGSFKSSSYDLDKERDSFAVPRISISQLNVEKSVIKENDGKNDAPERGQWSKGIQSLLLCLSMSVGLGNIWRFPNIAYNNGGGAFLIPYLLLLFIIGRPLYYLELILGQFCSQGPIKMWRIVPAFKEWFCRRLISALRTILDMSYFTAFFPFFGLIALLIIACLEEGSWEGIKFFFKPDLEKLKDINVWYKATEQSFFSLTVAYGNIVMIASYNKFHNNVYRDAMIISVLDTFVNILAGCVSFAVLGSLSHKYAKDIREVVNHEGLGLAFIVYPEALAAIKYVPQLWSVIFFFMLFVLGVGSSMSMIETILTIIKDKFPVLRKKEWLLAMGICSMFFALGVPLTTNVGQLILVILNNYGAGIAVFFYAVLELVGVMWIYGLKNFCQDVEFMLNKPPGIFWKVTWAFTAPVALTIIFIIGIIDAESTVDPTLPDWASAMGWFLAALALVQIPLWFIVAVYRDPHIGVIKKVLSALKPAENWGPSDPVHNADWRAMKMAARKDKIPVNFASTVSAAYQNQSYKEDVF
ncbi:sodium-dependent nutrient amino acid transporter 1-like isoform X3 [Stegodyphus dumicola]|uniref:sodium-dependent nutrient amino acid transporter 1-like isoform X3 n=1 Tax=Stegodyphus dumicola TaxID=202533 RepID=UPI0015B000F1|nr:sodium-dependent nutrient amino acid transporter 1-like isoform X3 [Stegodyphus dumicola]